MWLKISQESMKKQGDGLTKGTYQLILDPFLLSNPSKELIISIMNKICPITHTSGEHRWVVEKAWLEKGNIGIQVKVLQNSLALVIILGSCGFLLSGFLLWKVLVEVRKLFEIFGITLPIVLIIVVIAGSLWFFSNKKWRKK